MPTPKPSARETLLTFLLLSLVAAGFLLFFVSIMGHALFIMGTLAFFGLFHYVVWGRSMSREVATEQEDETAPTDADGWPPDGPHRPRDFQ